MKNLENKKCCESFPSLISFAKASTLIFFSQREGTKSEHSPTFTSICLVLPLTFAFIVGTFGIWIPIMLDRDETDNPHIPTAYFVVGNMLITALSTTTFQYLHNNHFEKTDHQVDTFV